MMQTEIDHASEEGQHLYNIQQCTSNMQFSFVDVIQNSFTNDDDKSSDTVFGNQTTIQVHLKYSKKSRNFFSNHQKSRPKRFFNGYCWLKKHLIDFTR